MASSLIEEAKKIDKKIGPTRKKRHYSDDEIMLAGEWFEKGVSNASVSKVMKIDKRNVAGYMAAALKQGIGIGRVGFVWYPMKGTEDGKARSS